MSTHTYMVAYMQRYVSYAVLASLCLQHWQLLPTLPRLYCVMVGMCLAASSWQSNSFSTCTTYSCFPLCAAVLYDGRGVLGWWPIPPSQLVAGLCCTTCSCCPLCDGRDALGCCATFAPNSQFWQRCAVWWRCSIPGPAMYYPLTQPPDEQMADILSCIAMFSHRVLLSYHPLCMGSSHGYGNPESC